MPSDTCKPRGDARHERLQWLGLALGPVLAALAYAAVPETAVDAHGGTIALGQAGRATAAVAVWMATWWMSEAIPVYATALLPLALFPTLGVATMGAAAAPYGHELIFLFMGGFVLALAMERWGLHRRIALRALRAAGTRPTRLVGAFMGVTAGLSMWVSNTATAIMMLPVATSVIQLVQDRLESDALDPAVEGGRTLPASARQLRHLSLALLLGIAYGASIGGVGTLIGTPPNLFLASFAKSQLGQEISFVRWLGIGLPLVGVFLPITWLLLTRLLYPLGDARIEGGEAMLREQLASLGPLSRGEKITLAVFALTSSLWILRPLLRGLELFGVAPFSGLSDAGIAMLAAVILFVCPVEPRERVFAMDWETAVQLPWGVLILFGGGLSLAAAIQANGVSELLGARFSALAGIPTIWVIVAIVTLIIFLTELTSNTATTATMIPIVAALATSLDVAPLLLAVPAAIGASCAFMLPVATPPNAVVFGSGRVPIGEMSRAGLALNAIGVVLITALAYAVVAPVLGLGS